MKNTMITRRTFSTAAALAAVAQLAYFILQFVVARD